MVLKICLVLISMFTMFRQAGTIDTRLIDATNYEKASTLDCAESTSSTFACLATCVGNQQRPESSSADKLPLKVEKIFNSTPRKLEGNMIQKIHKLSTFCTRKAQRIKLEIVGNRQVYFSLKRKMTWFGAQKFCRSKGMKLGGVDTREKEKALSSFIISQTGVNKTEFEMWSSGCNLASRDKGFYSVESGLPPPQPLKKTDKKPAKSTCQFLQKWNTKSDSVTSSDEICKMEKLFFCEPSDMCYEFPFALEKSCSNPKCPVVTCSVEKNVTLQTRAKGVQTKFQANYIGSMAVFISNIQASYLEATMLCCKLLGVPLISLKNKEIKYCLSKRMNVTTGTYWSSGIGDSCDSKYAWCGIGEEVSSEFEWTRGALHDSRGNTDNCLAIEVTPEGLHRLISMACSTKTLFICQGDLSPVKTEVTKAITVVTTTTKAPAVLATIEEPIDCHLLKMQQYFCIASCISYVRDDSVSSIMYKGACTAPPIITPSSAATSPGEDTETSSVADSETTSEEVTEEGAGEEEVPEESDTTEPEVKITTLKFIATKATLASKIKTTTAAPEEEEDPGAAAEEE